MPKENRKLRKLTQPTITEKTATSFRATWIPVDSNVVSHRLLLNTVAVQDVPMPTLTWVFTGLTPTQTYNVQVRGMDALGNIGPHSDPLYVTLPAETTPPTPPPPPPPVENKRPKKIFGHYMGCYAAGTGAIQYHATLGHEELGAPSDIRRDLSKLGAWAKTSYGGTYRNYGLAPQDSGRTLLQSAEIEIKRAIRIGLDGFTFDTWAGGKSARDLMDAMFTICETQNLPFELTISLDTNTMNDSDPDLAIYPGNLWEKTLHWLLDRHGDSPKLAKRDGKVLIMGYQSIWPGIGGIYSYVDAQHPEYTPAERDAAVYALRRTQQGWALIADRYKQMETNVGRDIYWQFDMYAFFEGAGGEGVTDAMWAEAAAYMATRFPALGYFLYHRSTPVVGQAAVAAGAEWSPPTKMQYENYGWYQVASPGLDWVRSDWVNINSPGRTLIQFITWNDYHENTNLSPGYNTRYAYYDLTGEYIKAWKAGGVPLASSRDKVYIFSHKYAHNTPMFPFKALSRADNEIEIITVLPTAAKIRCPGRTTTLGESVWDAPAGMSYRRLPLTVGPVSVQWSRDNFVSDINTLALPDPVSDRPFRQDVGKVAISTEDAAHWALDFPGLPMFVYSEYADSDGDGLPNWFEMLWYGKFGMMNTATSADANADPANTGKTNLQHYIDQTDPYVAVVNAPPVETWVTLREIFSVEYSEWQPSADLYFVDESVNQTRIKTTVWKNYEKSSLGNERNISFETQQQTESQVVAGLKQRPTEKEILLADIAAFKLETNQKISNFETRINSLP